MRLSTSMDISDGIQPGGVPETRFITKWTLTDGADLDVVLWAQVGGTTLFDVDWGDGATESGITVTNKSHTYASTGTYEIKISGQFPGLDLNYSGIPSADRAKLTELSNWGSEAEVYDFYQMFYQAVNMVYAATDAPDLSNLKAGAKLSYAFNDCTSIVNLDLSSWENVSGFTEMYDTFRGTDNCETLNLSGWNLSALTTAFQAFYEVGKTSGCDLNLSNVTMGLAGLDVRRMSRYTNFSTSPNLTNFDISGVDNIVNFMDYSDGNVAIDFSDLDFTSAATSFNGFASYSEATSITFGSGSDFGGITNLSYSFNNCPNLTTVTFPSNCDFSAVTTFSRGFYGSSSVTTIDLGTIQDFALVTSWGTFRGLGSCSVNFLTTTNIQSTAALSDLFYGSTLQTSDYDNLLQALDNAGNSSGNLQGGGSTYTAAGAGGTARAALVTAGWTIADGGAA